MLGCGWPMWVAGWVAASQDGFCRVCGTAAGTGDEAFVLCRAEEAWCRWEAGCEIICTHCIQEHQEP